MQNAAKVARAVAGGGDPGIASSRCDPAGITDPGYSFARKKAPEHSGNIMRICGRGKFIRYRIDLFIFLRTLNHRVDKTRPVRTKHPGDAHNEMVVLNCKHILFSDQF